MPLLVDAFNVLHVTGVLPPDLAGLDLPGLADLIRASRFDREEVWLVCDGARETGRRKAPRGSKRRDESAAADPSASGVVVSWAGRGVSADAMIIGLVQRSSAPRRLTVVSSDRAIAKAVRRRDAEVMTSEAFLTALAADYDAPRRSRPRRGKPTAPLSPSDVHAWLELFGLDAATHSLPASGSKRPGDRPPGDSKENAPAADAAASPTPVRSKDPAAPRDPRSSLRRRNEPLDDRSPLELGSFDLARLLSGPTPRRDAVRAPRRSRRPR